MRTQAIIRTDDYRRMALRCRHVITGDDHLPGSDSPTVRSGRRYRHGRQIRDIEFLAIPPRITSGAHIENWIIKRYKKAVTRNGRFGEVTESAKDHVQFTRRSQRLRKSRNPFKQSF